MSNAQIEVQQDYSWQSVEQIEHALKQKSFSLRFPPPLERQFERESMAANRKMLCIHAIMATVFFNAFGVFDQQLYPGALGEVFVLRGVLYTVFSLIVGYGVYNASTPRVRDVFLLFGGFSSAGLLALLVSICAAPNRIEFLYGIVPMMMFGVFVLRIRFPYSLVLVAGFVAIHGSAVYALGDLGKMPGYTVGVVTVTAIFTLIAGHRIESEHRTNYLNSLRERLRTQSFERLAEIDPLTGVGNRRALKMRLAELKRSGVIDCVAVVFADIDYFKAYNDNFGHVAGDECLTRVARLLEQDTRVHGDQVYRYGGEEFVVVLEGQNDASAVLVAERMRRSVRRANIPHCWPSAKARVTVSLGIAAAQLDDGFDFKELFKNADAALYQAKQDGRNCVRTAKQHFVASVDVNSANSA